MDFDIGFTLRKRLEEITEKKEAVAAKISTSSEQLQRLFAKNKNAIRSTEPQLDAKIEELENRRVSVSLPLAEEKKILREIDQIKKSKIQVKENAGTELLIREKKAEIDAYRTTMRSMSAQIAELVNAIRKVDLAERLGCSPTDLQTRAVDCPVNKLGRVIGKNGANIQKLEKKTGCNIDVDKVKGAVHLRGNEDAIAKAVKEIEDIAHGIDEEVKLSEAVFQHFFQQRMEPFKQLQIDHEDVYFDLSKESRIMKIRGRSEPVEAAKKAIAEFDIAMDSIKLAGRETAIVVGKGGVMIKALIEKFSVGIQVDRINDDSSVAKIVGLPSDVEEAVKEINFMLFKCEDIETSIVVSALAKNGYLENSGALIKQLQKDVNQALDSAGIRLNFEKKEVGAESSSIALLRIKAPRSHHLAAVDFVKPRIEQFESKVFVIKVEDRLIPKIIGKKGENINAMRKIGKGATIEVGRLDSEVSVLAADEATKELIKAEIEKIVAKNQILQIPVESKMMGLVFGSLGKDMRSKIAKIDVNISQDGNDTVMFKGYVESITEAAIILREYIANNYTIEVDFDSSDTPLLGRRDSILKTLGEDSEVNLYLSRQKQVIEVRGPEDKAKAAAEALIQFLNGGDGNVVEKVTISRLVVGAIIGKGGSGITKLEKDHEGVSANVSSDDGTVTLRGPEEPVRKCRGKIMKEIVKTQVNALVDIDDSTHEFLSKTSNIRKIMNSTGVNLTLMKTGAKLRGNIVDVEIVKENIKEVMTGTYNGRIALSPALFRKISNLEKTKARMQLVNEKTNAKVELDSQGFAFVLSGKKVFVKRGKSMMLDYLITDFPSSFSKIKIPVYLLKLVARTDTVVGIAADTGSSVAFDHDIYSFIIQSPSNQCLVDGSDAVRKHVLKSRKNMNLVQVDKSESWIFADFLRKPDLLSELQESTECRIEIYREDSVLCIIGKESEKIEAAKAKVTSIIEKLRKENIFMDLPESSMNTFVGQSNRNMRQFASIHFVNIQRVKKNPTRIHIKGSEAKARLAELSVKDWVMNWEKKNPGSSINLDVFDISYLLDPSSSDERQKIQKELDVKIDINGFLSTVTVRGGKDASSPEKALVLIRDLVDEHGDADIDEESSASPSATTASNEIVQKIDEQAVLKGLPTQNTAPVTTKKVSQAVEPQAPLKENLVIPEECAVPTVDIKPKKMEAPSAKLQSVSNLYNFLVSDDAAPVMTGDYNEPWDSSTVSSAVEIEEGYFRSSSGFTVRL